MAGMDWLALEGLGIAWHGRFGVAFPGQERRGETWQAWFSMEVRGSAWLGRNGEQVAVAKS